jgi:HK97 family phage major capsid protein
MEEKDLIQIKTLVEDAVKPLVTKLDETVTASTALADRVTKIEKTPAPAPQFMPVTIRGSRRLPALGGESAPAYVRPKSLGDRPYSLSNVIRAIVERDDSLAPLEVHISERLKGMQFPSTNKRSYLVPLSSAEDYFPPNEGSEELRKLLIDALPETPADPREVAMLMKQSRPDIAKAMDPMNDAAGGSFIEFPTRGELVELLRAATVMGKVGAQEVPLPPGGLDYPTEAGATTFARRAPGSQTVIADSTPATGSVKLMPKELAGMVKIPNTLIRWSNPAVEAVVRRALAADAGIASDLDYLQGQGGTLSPLGILNYQRSVAETPTRNRVTLHVASTTGGNGDTFTVEDVQLMLSLVEEAPDAEGPNAWIMYPRKFYNLANARADAVTAADGKGPFLFPVTRGAMSGAIMKELGGLPVVTSTQISRTRAKSAGLNLTYILAGNFRRAVIGRLGALELAASSDAGFSLNETWIRAILYDDFALLHPESIVVCDTLVL